MKGKKLSAERIEQISRCHLGKRLSEETKEKIRVKFLGKNNPFYGKKHSEESLRKKHR